jgi:hypothetical protein
LPDIDTTVADNTRRIGELEVEVGRVGLSLAHNEERAKERHEVLSTQQIRMMDLLEERDREARDYRMQREERETQATLANRRWMMSLVNPQTVWIILSIILAAVGMKSIDMSEIVEAVPDVTP